MPYKLNVDLLAVNAGYDYAVLTGKTDIFPYEDGKKLSDVRTGVKLTLSLQGARLAPLAVKFDHDPILRATRARERLLNGKHSGRNRAKVKTGRSPNNSGGSMYHTYRRRFAYAISSR